MNGWHFKAHTPQGKIYEGVIQATSIAEVERTLARQKLIPDRIRRAPMDRSFQLRRTPTRRAMVQFARQFATLMAAAVPLVLSLEILQGLTDDRPLRQALEKVTSAIQAGSTLADALRRHPKVFSDIFVAVLDAGEQGGSLDAALLRLAEYMERAQEVSERVRGAMIYPAVIVAVAIGAIITLLTLVVPTFQGMFASSGLALPYATQILVDTSHFVAGNLRYLIVAGLSVTLVLKGLYDTEVGKRVVHRLALHLPVMGSLIRKTAVARFSRTISSLLGSGVPILDALEAASRTTGNVVIERAVMQTRDGVEQGLGVSGPLAMARVLPPLVSRMVNVGEQTGRLDEMFSKVADFYEREVDAAVDGLLKALEPALVVLVGALLGGIVVAMYLPIFDAVGTVG